MNKKRACFVLAPDVVEEYLTGVGKNIISTNKLIEDTKGVYKVTTAMALIGVLKRLPIVEGMKLKIFLDNVKISGMRADGSGIRWEL